MNIIGDERLFMVISKGESWFTLRIIKNIERKTFGKQSVLKQKLLLQRIPELTSTNRFYRQFRETYQIFRLDIYDN